MDSVPFTATRRTLLRSLPGVAAGAALPGLIGVGAAATAASLNAEADDFDMMRGQWRELHVTDGYDPTDPEISPVLSAIDDDAAAWWSKMETGDGRDYLWPDARLEVEESFAIKRSFERLYAMALAWATPGASHHGDADLLADVVAALDWMVAHYYTEDGEVVGNWYEWKISGPMAFNNAVVLLYDQLSGEQVSAYGRAVGHYTPEPVFTAANRALTSSVVVGRGVLTGDSDTVSLGVDGLDSVLTIVTSGEGFYPDGSFIQHEFYPYVGAYGTLLLDAVAPIFRTTAGTSWQLDPEVVYTWLRDAFDPVIWRGALMDMVSGRIISRYDELDHYRARYALISGLALAALASPEQAEWLLPMLKEWLVSDEHPDPKPMHLVPGLLDGIELRDDDSVSRRGELVGSKVYHHQDRIVHRRPEWTLGVSMYSTRIANFESINDENLRSWLTASGATYLYTGDSRQFNEAFWPTVNHYRIPGTTVDVRSRDAGEGNETLSPRRWAGGACLDGRYTAGGMNVAVQGGSLELKKSWMCFDDEVVALGAAISAGDGHPIETVVENRRLGADGLETVLVDDAEPVPDLGSEADVADAHWLHLAGTGGYVFPTPTTLKLKREARTGRWSDVNKHLLWALPDPMTHNYLTAWLDHGTDPDDGAYVYVLLPNASAEQTREYSAEPNIEVVVNTGECQAARALEQGVLCANFWAPGTASIITTDSNSASVAVSEGAEELTVAIADPTQVATTFTTTVAVTVDSVISADPGLSVTSMDPLTIDVDLTGAAGATRTLRAKYQPATADAWRSLLAEQHTAGEVDAAARDRLDEEAHALNTRRQVNSLRRTLLEHRDAGVTPAAAAKLDDMAQRLAAQAD